MKYLFALVFALFTLGNVSAQKWYNNLEEAQAVAQKTDKHILMMFTGSDWCGYCIRLEKKVLSKDKFNKIARDKFVFLKIDFPKRKSVSLKQMNYNKALLHRYNPQAGFPKLLILDKNLKTKGSTGFRKDKPEAYAKHLIEFIR